MALKNENWRFYEEFVFKSKESSPLLPTCIFDFFFNCSKILISEHSLIWHQICFFFFIKLFVSKVRIQSFLKRTLERNFISKTMKSHCYMSLFKVMFQNVDPVYIFEYFLFILICWDIGTFYWHINTGRYTCRAWNAVACLRNDDRTQCANNLKVADR